MQNGLHITGSVIDKATSTYTNKKTQKDATNYELTLFTGGKTNPSLRVNEEAYIKITKGDTITAPIGYSTFLYGSSKDQIGVGLYLRKGQVTNEDGEILIDAPTE